MDRKECSAGRRLEGSATFRVAEPLLGYLALTSTTDCELPPSVNTLIGVSPAFNDGTVASSVVSFTYVKVVLDGPNDTRRTHTGIHRHDETVL